MSDSFNEGRATKGTVSGKAARNDHTGALIKTKPVTDAYREGWERIFGKDEDAEAPKEK